MSFNTKETTSKIPGDYDGRLPKLFTSTTHLNLPWPAQERLEMYNKLTLQQFVIIQIDAQLSFRPLNDPILNEAASKITGKYYLALIEDLSSEERKGVLDYGIGFRLVGKGVPKRQESKGVDERHCIPIIPCKQHSERRTPIITTPPFYLPNHYLYTYNAVAARVGTVCTIGQAPTISDDSLIEKVHDYIDEDNGPIQHAREKTSATPTSDSESGLRVEREMLKPLHWRKELHDVVQQVSKHPAYFWLGKEELWRAAKAFEYHFDPGQDGELRHFFPLVNVTQRPFLNGEQFGSMDDFEAEMEVLEQLAIQSDLRWLEEIRTSFCFPPPEESEEEVADAMDISHDEEETPSEGASSDCMSENDDHSTDTSGSISTSSEYKWNSGQDQCISVTTPIQKYSLRMIRTLRRAATKARITRSSTSSPDPTAKEYNKRLKDRNERSKSRSRARHRKRPTLAQKAADLIIKSSRTNSGSRRALRRALLIQPHTLYQ